METKMTEEENYLIEKRNQVLNRLKRLLKVEDYCNSFYDDLLIQRLHNLQTFTLNTLNTLNTLTPPSAPFLNLNAPKFIHTEWIQFIDDDMALQVVEICDDSPELSFCLALEMLNPAVITLSSEFHLAHLRTCFFGFIATHQESIEEDSVNQLWRYINEEIQENREEMTRLADLSCKMCTLTPPMGKSSYVFWCTQMFLSTTPDSHVGLFLCLGQESEKFGNIFWKMFKPSQKLLSSLPTLSINNPISEFLWRLRAGHDPYDDVVLSKAEREPLKQFMDVLWFFMWVNCKNTTHVDKICELKIPTGVPMWPPKGIFIPNPLLEYLSLKSPALFQMYQHSVNEMLKELE